MDIKLKKILKIIGIIIAILVIFLLIHTIRNCVIIKGLQSKIIQYANSNNYYLKSITTESNGTIVTIEFYKKDNKKVVFLERNINRETNKIAMYDDGKSKDTFIETKDSKIAQLNSGIEMSVNIYNHLETENNWQTLLGSIFSKISSTNDNGKECYKIKGFLSPTSLTSEETEIYIEKETGLFVKSIEDNIITERKYEFNNVEDTIFTKPDISQYTLKENN